MTEQLNNNMVCAIQAKLFLLPLEKIATGASLNSMNTFSTKDARNFTTN